MLEVWAAVYSGRRQSRGDGKGLLPTLCGTPLLTLCSCPKTSGSSPSIFIRTSNVGSLVPNLKGYSNLGYFLPLQNTVHMLFTIEDGYRQLSITSGSHGHRQYAVSGVSAI